MGSTESVALVLRGYRAFVAGDFSTVAGLLAPDVETTLAELIERELAVRVPRRAGQKEQRYAHTLGGEAPATSDATTSSLEQRVARLEEQIAELLERLR